MKSSSSLHKHATLIEDKKNDIHLKLFELQSRLHAMERMDRDQVQIITEFEEYKVKNTDMKSIIADKKKEFSDLQNELAEENEKISEHEAKISDVEKQLAGQNEHLLDEQKKMKDLEEQHSTTNAELQTCLQDIRKNKAALEALAIPV